MTSGQGRKGTRESGAWLAGRLGRKASVIAKGGCWRGLAGLGRWGEMAARGNRDGTCMGGRSEKGVQGGDYSMFPPVHEKREEEGEPSQAFSSSPQR